MGIWLAAVASPKLFKDQAWSCFGLEKGCEPTALAIPELSPRQLRRVWHSWEQCGSPCGCTGPL